MAPICVAGISGAYKFGWRVIGKEPIADEEKFLPDVKGGWSHIAPVQSAGYIMKN